VDFAFYGKKGLFDQFVFMRLEVLPWLQRDHSEIASGTSGKIFGTVVSEAVLVLGFVREVHFFLLFLAIEFISPGPSTWIG
jgi:hypothetical protein